MNVQGFGDQNKRLRYLVLLQKICVLQREIKILQKKFTEKYVHKGEAFLFP